MVIRQGPTSFEEVKDNLRKNSQFRKAERRVAPYFDLALEVITRRIQLGLTQKELAEKANTFQSRISKIESGEHDIRFSTLIDIAEALNCQVAKNLIVPISDSDFQSNAIPFITLNTILESPPQLNNEYINIKDYQYA